MTNRLFTPVRLGSLELPNRVLMAPLTRRRAQDDATPSEMMATYYAQRASAGLIIAEMTIVSADGHAYQNAPGLHAPAHRDGWKKITDAVHAAGGRIIAQIGHGGRISHSSLLPDGQLPVAPSAIRPEGRVYTSAGPVPFETPRALDITEIPRVVEQFRQATRMAQQAGFDGIELHGANGYLLDQFLRDGSNQRADEYGGSAENRARLLAEVAAATAEVWSPGRVGVRLSPYNPYNSMADSNPEMTFSVAARLLAPLGLAFLHIIEPAPAVLAGTLKQLFGGPVIVNGGYTAETGHFVIESGRADAVSFGSPFIANPDLPVRLELGLPLAAGDPSTFYLGGAAGYTDYPVAAPPAIAAA